MRLESPRVWRKVAPCLNAQAKAAFSKAIQLTTSSAFSHAALVLNPYAVLEAVTPYVQITNLKTWTHHDPANGQLMYLGSFQERITGCAVLRHPKVAGLSPERVEESLKVVMRRFFGDNYSQLSRLVKFLPDSEWKSVLLRLSRAWDDSQAHQRVYGPFCSELVATWFEMIGLGLFPQQRPPDGVTPSALAHSLLVEVDAVVPAEHLTGKMEEHPVCSISASLGGLAKVINGQKVNSRNGVEALKSMRVTINVIQQHNRETVLALLKETHQQLSKLIKDAGELGHPVAMVKVAALVPCFDLKTLAAICRGQITDPEACLRALTEFQQFQASLIRLTCFVQNRLLRRSQAMLLEAKPTAQTMRTIQEQRSAMARQTALARESIRQVRSKQWALGTSAQAASG